MSIKIIETKSIPPNTSLRGKTSKVPELLKQIPKGKTAEIPNTPETKTATIRSYIEKQHKKGHLTSYTLQQRTNNKQTTLYITHETSKPDKC